jgi:hypothetical protein
VGPNGQTLVPRSLIVPLGVRERGHHVLAMVRPWRADADLDVLVQIGRYMMSTEMTLDDNSAPQGAMLSSETTQQDRGQREF